MAVKLLTVCASGHSQCPRRNRQYTMTSTTPSDTQLQLIPAATDAQEPPPLPQSPPAPETPETVLSHQSNAQSVVDLPRQEILQIVFESECTRHRWERQLLLGATDDELRQHIGNSSSYGAVEPMIDLRFRTDEEPALTVTYHTFNVILATATSEECVAAFRRIAQIPQRKPDKEYAKLLAAKLDEIRSERRQYITTYVRGLVGEKRTKRPKKNTGPIPPPSITEQIVERLFAPDCMSDTCDKRLLFFITKLLYRKASQDILTATDNAIQIIKRAKSDWACYTSYWTGEHTFSSAYKPGKEAAAT